ncbi:MAG: 2-hydroxyhepta-2,4-diene-1,7-dioate isomerase [Porticoccaceae bacterium]|nr:MAG: 2-hydroxyhepta-2,4-diene-1,7-dioate isomerase [Porticoccaceae bacterium]
MRLVRYRHRGRVRYGDWPPDSDQVVPLTGRFPRLAPSGEPPVPLAQVRLLAPVRPSKVVAIGPGYRALLGDLPPPPRPYLWIKPPNCAIGPEAPIRLPRAPLPVYHEGELAIVIGRRARQVSAREAARCILGYTCLNDLTAGPLADREAYRKSLEFVDGKIFDTFAPLGPAVVTEWNDGAARIRVWVNGELRQDHPVADRLWEPAQLVALISQRLTLEPGDVIGTGSPPGPGPIRAGDRLQVAIDGIGTLANPVLGT